MASLAPAAEPPPRAHARQRATRSDGERLRLPLMGGTAGGEGGMMAAVLVAICGALVSSHAICDDKGVRFLIGFGMPGRAYEDDESRAVVSSLQTAAGLIQRRTHPWHRHHLRTEHDGVVSPRKLEDVLVERHALAVL